MTSRLFLLVALALSGVMILICAPATDSTNLHQSGLFWLAALTAGALSLMLWGPDQ